MTTMGAVDIVGVGATVVLRLLIIDAGVVTIVAVHAPIPPVSMTVPGERICTAPQHLYALTAS